MYVYIYIYIYIYLFFVCIHIYIYIHIYKGRIYKSKANDDHLPSRAKGERWMPSTVHRSVTLPGRAKGER